MQTKIEAIEFHVPMGTLTNDQLATEFPEWGVHRIYGKTGISNRHIAAEDECASDLALVAGVKLLDATQIPREKIDYLIFCTQSPDYFLPTTACLLQNRLGLSAHCAAIDINQGCSGYIYGLGLAKGLIESGQAERVLLLTADTYSKYLRNSDKSVRTLFGDGASATLLCGSEDQGRTLSHFRYGSDGAGFDNLIVKAGGARDSLSHERYLEMNGPEVLAFTLKRVPELVEKVLAGAKLRLEDIDFFVPHQANKLLLESLASKINLPPSKLIQEYEEYGNTVSSTIPIALKKSMEAGKFSTGDRLLLAGFGVGYSWGGCILEW